VWKNHLQKNLTINQPSVYLRFFGNIAYQVGLHKSAAIKYFDDDDDDDDEMEASRQTWMRTIQRDLGIINISLYTAWKQAQNREQWWQTVETAVLQYGACCCC